MLIHNVWVELEDGIEDKKPHSCRGTLPVDLPLQGKGVQNGEANGVPISQP